MKYLLTLLLCAFIAASFASCKREHVFVEVEQAKIKKEAIQDNEPIDTINAYYHSWIGPRRFVDSAYAAFLKEMHGGK